MLLVALLLRAMSPPENIFLQPEYLLVITTLFMAWHISSFKHGNPIKALAFLTTLLLLYPLSQLMVLFGRLETPQQILLLVLLTLADHIAAYQLARLGTSGETR